MNKLIWATGNRGKIAELQAILPFFDGVAQQRFNIPDAEETGLSFVENAIIKARHASRLGGLPALADDSGLVVPALLGAPGIYSARFAGVDAQDEDNITLLLERMQHLSDEQRKAYFYCAIVCVEHADDPTPLIGIGQLAGYITKTQQGVSGFGYDPIFYVPEYQLTLAQISPDIKNKISHRAKALGALQPLLDSFAKRCI
jgi:XTP/dITP diphosphohydrolase